MIACGPAGEPSTRWVEAPFGEPVPGLTSDELARFGAGQRLFAHPYTEAEGLGPRFNENACNGCHTDPADGGTGETAVMRASRVAADGVCDPLTALGGENLRIRLVGADRAASTRVPTPQEATAVTRFTIPFVFGLGVVDAIPERTLRALEDPDDLDGDGISGRLGRDADGNPARFGRKGDVGTLADFVEVAFRMEMGLTTAIVPDERRAGALPPVAGHEDAAPDPEVSLADLGAVTDFLRMLAPPVRGAPRDADDEEAIRRGGELFEALTCVRCHVPSLTAGSSPIAAIDGATIALYSDLLLHDMGPGLEGTCTPGASTREYRTEPLMGLRARRIFLHDGRARSVLDAILAHGGEARNAREAFAALDRVTQEVLIRFLDTL